jgi:hypothetical protein
MSERHGRTAQAKPAAVGRGVDGHTPRQRTWWLEGRSFEAEILHVQDLLALGLCFESNFPLPVNTCRENGLRPRASQARNINARAGSTRVSPGAGGQLRGSTPLFRGCVDGGGCQLRTHSVSTRHPGARTNRGGVWYSWPRRRKRRDVLHAVTYAECESARTRLR